MMGAHQPFDPILVTLSMDGGATVVRATVNFPSADIMVTTIRVIRSAGAAAEPIEWYNEKNVAAGTTDARLVMLTPVVGVATPGEVVPGNGSPVATAFGGDHPVRCARPEEFESIGGRTPQIQGDADQTTPYLEAVVLNAAAGEYTLLVHGYSI